MTVREAARAFEDAGVARTERSITNWCQLNRQGVSRLDCYFEPNDHKYFITPQGVDRAIKEELAKAHEVGTPPNPSELGKKEKVEEQVRPAPQPQPVSSEGMQAKLRELELKNRDLEIATRAKDRFIERLEKDREVFVGERQKLIDQLVSSSRQLGELENRPLQIETSRQDPNGSESQVREQVREAVENPPSYTG